MIRNSTQLQPVQRKHLAPKVIVVPPTIQSFHTVANMQPMKQRHKGNKQDWNTPTPQHPSEEEILPVHIESHRSPQLRKPGSPHSNSKLLYPVRWLSIHPIFIKQNKHTQLLLQFSILKLFSYLLFLFGYPCFFPVVIWNISCVFCHPPKLKPHRLTTEPPHTENPDGSPTWSRPGISMLSFKAPITSKVVLPCKEMPGSDTTASECRYVRVTGGWELSLCKQQILKKMILNQIKHHKHIMSWTFFFQKVEHRYQPPPRIVSACVFFSSISISGFLAKVQVAKMSKKW